MKDLLPDELVRLWGDVADGRLSPEEFHATQERLLDEYRGIWTKALILNGCKDLQESIVSEICLYFGEQDSEKTRQDCLLALAKIRDEWREKVDSIDSDSVESFYEESRAMLYELMWWHTLSEDLSPLAYVVAMEFARKHRCASFLDFGSGVGSGGILFAKNGFRVTLSDVSSTVLAFSSWRFEKRGLPVEHINLKAGELPEAHFDFISAMDVFEHLVDPVSTARSLSRSLKEGGFLFGRFHSEPDEDRPHHITHDFEPTLNELKSLGFEKVWQDRWLWGHEVFQKKHH